MPEGLQVGGASCRANPLLPHRRPAFLTEAGLQCSKTANSRISFFRRESLPSKEVKQPPHPRFSL